MVCSILLLFLGSKAAAQSDELAERSAVRSQAKAAYAAGDFESLERQHATYSDFLRQRTSSGAFKMSLFFDGVAEAVRGLDATQRLQDIERTQGWVNEHKDVPLVNL